MADTFRCTRSILIAAPAAAIAAEVTDLGRHASWSPFSKPDPKANDRIEGPAGVGQSRSFAGGRTGAGRLEIDVVEPQRIAMTLAMTKPFRSTNLVEYGLVPESSGTRVSWTMSGPKTLLCRIMGLFIDTDAMCGRMFEEGLAALKAHVEAGPAHRLVA